MEIIAHRGASFDAPENTLAAFALAFEQGADAIELDVHLTLDGQVVVMHDFTTWRIAGVDRAIREQNLKEIKSLDAGRWKHANWTGERIPTLTEVLGIVPQDKRVFIEVKTGPEILPELHKLITSSKVGSEQVAIIGFGYDTMQRAKQLMQECQVYWLRAFAPEHVSANPRQITDPLISKAAEAGLDGLDLLHSGPIDAQFIENAHQASQQVYLWTIDEPEVAQRMLALGIDGLSTNRPGWIRQQLFAGRQR